LSLVGRYYDPATGQFLSVDPEVDETEQPYAYTEDDPVNGVDPLGLCTTTEFGYLYAGPCATTGAQAIAAENGIQAASQRTGILGDVESDVEHYDPFYSALTDYEAEYHDAQDGCSLSTDFGDASRAIGNVVSGSSILIAPEAEAAEAANEGVYVIRSSLGDYVGQSGNIAQRLAGYVSSGRFTSEEVAAAERTLVTGGKTAREVAEQMEIDSRGGVQNPNLLNIRNPIGDARVPLMPQPYARP
jgi:hypothetical protein